MENFFPMKRFYSDAGNQSGWAFFELLFWLNVKLEGNNQLLDHIGRFCECSEKTISILVAPSSFGEIVNTTCVLDTGSE